MRRTQAALVLCGLGVLGLAAAAPAPDKGDEIRRKGEVLLQAATSGPGEVEAALRRLVEIAGELGREARLPAAAQAKLDEAAAQARQRSPLDDATRASLSEAYAALDDGRPFRFPKQVGSIDQAREHGRGQLDRCLAALSAGRPKEAARELVSLVLLVITPMEAPR